MPTIVDSLIITLGLDPTDFSRNEKKMAADLIKGQRAVQRSVKETSSSVDKAAKQTGKAITDMARQFALAFLGFAGAAGFTAFLAKLNGMARTTKAVATNLGTSATELKRFQNVAELSGSTKEAATGFLQQIQEQQYQQETTGLPGWVKELRSMNYDLFESDGNGGQRKKDEMQVAMELAGKFKQLEKERGRDTAVQRFNAMGIDLSMITMMGRGPEWQAQQLKRQQQRYGDNEGAFNGADKVAQTFTNIKQRLEDIFLKLLAKLQPFIDQLAGKFDKWLANVDLAKLADSIIELTTQLSALIPVLAQMAGGVGKAVADTGEWLGEKAGAIAEGWDALMRSGDTAAFERGKKADPMSAKIFSAATEGSEFTRRNDTIADIVDRMKLGNDDNAQAKAIGRLREYSGQQDVDAPLTQGQQRAIQDTLRKMMTLAAPAATTGALMQAPNLSYAGASARVASNSSSSRSQSSSVSVGEVNINGASGNGRQIASDFVGELQRRKLVAQADYGMA